MQNMQTATASYNPAPIREYRLRNRWSQAEAARRASRHQTWWSRLEAGKGNPTSDDLDRLARLFGVKKTTLARQIFDTPESHTE